MRCSQHKAGEPPAGISKVQEPGSAKAEPFTKQVSQLLYQRDYRPDQAVLGGWKMREGSRANSGSGAVLNTSQAA